MVHFPSCNVCTHGVDLVVSFSDGEPGSDPQGAKVLQLTWDDIVELVLERGKDVPELTLDAMTKAAAALKTRGD